eukprot:gnl/MRDRNA2_/MRDRNA2_177224_c0_seq1.p1 gnl/MRDRNA2_/MRDRNA2_177224_c0~~gnl/MRDRNA2_/MRDRNA2_177224_c0_seq1.p1  ORF type:complete len:315 (+),score=73.18 gnl/MRDRNA2_/MRDRNA2_177224_c0_seq1:47-991(+)
MVSPDVGMAGVGRHKEKFFSQERFYKQAAEGSLPSFSWVMAPYQACDHPCYDVAKGERFLKDIYEALRASPKWNKTLFLVVYDDAGGFYDHVIPPSDGVPSDEAPCHVKSGGGCGSEFDFRRLGLRTTAILASPWIEGGKVIQEPKNGPFNTSQFELTSIPATVKSLFNLTGFLTKRDAWAGSFEELLMDAPTNINTPMHLPDAPEPAAPWDPPPTFSDGRDTHEDAGGFWVDSDGDADGDDRRLQKSRPIPQHCGQKEQVCRGPHAVTQKQRNNMNIFAALTNVRAPNAEQMTNAEANRWLSEHAVKWYNQDL